MEKSSRQGGSVIIWFLRLKIRVCWIEDPAQFNPRAARATSPRSSGGNREYPCLPLKPARHPAVLC